MARSGFGIRPLPPVHAAPALDDGEPGHRGVAIACPVGLFVRAWLLERNVSYLFGAVTFGLMLALLLLWRLPWVVAARAGRGRSA